MKKSKNFDQDILSEEEKELNFLNDLYDNMIAEIEDKFNLSVGIIVGYSVLTLTILTLLVSIRNKFNMSNHILAPLVPHLVRGITNPYTVFFICLLEAIYAGYAGYAGVKGKIRKNQIRRLKMYANKKKYTKKDLKFVEEAMKRYNLRIFEDKDLEIKI